MTTTKRSSYRQSGYLNLSTGETEEFYGGQLPTPTENYKLIWDNEVTEVITITPVVAEAAPAPSETVAP